MLTSAVLLATSLVTFAAAPASADAPAPALLLDFEAETPVGPPYAPLAGMQFSGDGDNGWTHNVVNGDKPGGSIGSTIMRKGKMGSGAYSGIFIAKTTTDSLVSSTTKVVTMNFWAP